MANDWGPRTIVAESAAMQCAFRELEQVAPTQSTVLLLGETGVGKEVFAQAIHDRSPRACRPMTSVNCAAIPAGLLDSELFGRERGAYTDAHTRQVGRFEAAHRSTLLLDEIGDLPSPAQVKLLRVLQERVIERVGSAQPVEVDVRIIAATNRNLEEAVANGSFREDLFYRLNVFPIRVPPLRERVSDIPLLVWCLVEELSPGLGKRIEEIVPEHMIALQQYPWPGNIRELRNVIERAMIVATGPRLSIPVPRLPAKGSRAVKLVEVQKEHIRGILESTGWRIRGAGGAAERLGLRPTTLETRMVKLGLVRPSVLVSRAQRSAHGDATAG